jgi:NAD(P)-dependent dehydrogenase (short-subunit alcohol dehydrogenase family)
MGAEVALACRSRKKAQLAMQLIRKSVKGAKVWFVELDLGSLASVRQCAQELVSTSSFALVAHRRFALAVGGLGVLHFFARSMRSTSLVCCTLLL